MTVEEAYGQHRRIKQGLAQASRDYYTGQFNSDSARLTAADVLMELTVQEEAAVRALCRAVLEEVFGVGWDEHLESLPEAALDMLERSALEAKTRIDLLGKGDTHC